MCVCVCVCVCEWERETWNSSWIFLGMIWKTFPRLGFVVTTERTTWRFALSTSLRSTHPPSYNSNLATIFGTLANYSATTHFIVNCYLEPKLSKPNFEREYVPVKYISTSECEGFHGGWSCVFMGYDTVPITQWCSYTPQEQNPHISSH